MKYTISGNSLNQFAINKPATIMTCAKNAHITPPIISFLEASNDDKIYLTINNKEE